MPRAVLGTPAQKVLMRGGSPRARLLKECPGVGVGSSPARSSLFGQEGSIATMRNVGIDLSANIFRNLLKIPRAMLAVVLLPSRPKDPPPDCRSLGPNR